MFLTSSTLPMSPVYLHVCVAVFQHRWTVGYEDDGAGFVLKKVLQQLALGTFVEGAGGLIQNHQ